MADSEDLDLPIALRRVPRRCVNPAAEEAASAHLTQPPRAAAPVSSTSPETPRKTRSKKRVRFSDPGPDVSHDDASSQCSTGLTPMVKRSSLGEPSLKRRRSPSAAAAAATTTRRRQLATDIRNADSIDDIDVLSLPAGLDDRAKRRVRREKNRLSEEPVISKRKSTRARTRRENEEVAAEVEAEIQRLRCRLADRDAEIARLNNETIIQDTERILVLEKQIEQLRAELAREKPPASVANKDDEEDSSSDATIEDDMASKSFYDWTLSTRDPFSSSQSDDDSEDVTMADVACSTPSRRRKRANETPTKTTSAPASFPTPPSTSPIQPATPSSMRRAMHPIMPLSHAGIQASLPDPEKAVLEAELASLRRELGKLTAMVETHVEEQTRLSEKLAGAFTESILPGAETDKSDTEELEANLDKLLRTLSERTAALQEFSASLSTMGFAGEDSTEILATMTANFRAARLELEYLTPGEVPLPLSSHGAEVLDLVLTQLRDLARKAREDEDAIEEYQKIELSLHQQLKEQSERHDPTTLRERDDRIAELETELESLKGAADGYQRDAAELQTRVDDGVAATAKLDADLTASRDELTRRDAVVEDLEGKLSGARVQADELGAKVKELQKRRDAETKVRNQTAGAALALRDARVLELRKEIGVINERLRGAQETILKLRIENHTATRRVEAAEEESKSAREEVERLRNEIEAERAARRRRSGSRTPEPRPGSFLSADLARSGSSGRGLVKSKGLKSEIGLGYVKEELDEGEV